MKFTFLSNDEKKAIIIFSFGAVTTLPIYLSYGDIGALYSKIWLILWVFYAYKVYKEFGKYGFFRCLFLVEVIGMAIAETYIVAFIVHSSLTYNRLCISKAETYLIILSTVVGLLSWIGFRISNRRLSRTLKEETRISSRSPMKGNPL